MGSRRTTIFKTSLGFLPTTRRHNTNGRSLLDEHGIYSTNNNDDGCENCRHNIYNVLEKALLDFERNQFNTVIAACMTILNHAAQKRARKPSRHKRTYASSDCRGGQYITAPTGTYCASHLHTLWAQLGFGDSVLEASWPLLDTTALTKSSIELVVQVNGKCARSFRCRLILTKRTGRKTSPGSRKCAEIYC